MGKGQPGKVLALNILPHKSLDIYNVGKKGVTNGWERKVLQMVISFICLIRSSLLWVLHTYIPLYLSLNKRGKESQ
jgi:hypothetical protein